MQNAVSWSVKKHLLPENIVNSLAEVAGSSFWTLNSCVSSLRLRNGVTDYFIEDS